MASLGDIFLIHRCPDCGGDHELYLLPLDDGAHAMGVALATAWVYERAEGATDCRFLVLAWVDGRPCGLALRVEAGYLRGAIEALDPDHAYSPAQAYAVALRGVEIPPARADDAGAAALVLGALRRSAGDRALVEQLLKGINLE